MVYLYHNINENRYIMNIRKNQTSLNLRNYSIEFEQLLVSVGDLTVTKLVLPTMQSEACKTNI